jgi:uncharacterized protein YjbI with pentapeptide repeats
MNTPTALSTLLSITPRWTAAAAWNDLRRRNPDFKADFRYAVFPDDLSLAAADLNDSNFSGACLRNMSLRCARLVNAQFSKADLRGADLSASDLTNADLSAADLRGADLRGAVLAGVNFGGAYSDRYALQRHSCHQPSAPDGCDLSDAELRGANLDGTNLSQVRFNRAILVRAKLSRSILSAADMRGADLSSACLEGADLTNADCSYALLTDSDLRRAHLIGTSLTAADLSGADLGGSLMGWTNLSGTKLVFAHGLDRVEHLGPSIVDIDTLARCYRESSDSPSSKIRTGTTAMTVFVRGVGVPEDVIEIARKRSFSSQLAPCFISYSSIDLHFVRRLHRDLQDEGVRCWYAPEAMRVGEDIRIRIQEAIRKHARVIVVLSETSAQSEWVKFEVRTAVEEEMRSSLTNILLPIRIDSFTDGVVPDWVGAIRARRSIGDFRDWADSARYRAALRGLLEALLAT